MTYSLEDVARELFPLAYAAITDDSPMPEELIRVAQAETDRRNADKPLDKAESVVFSALTAFTGISPQTRQAARWVIEALEENELLALRY